MGVTDGFAVEALRDPLTGRMAARRHLILRATLHRIEPCRSSSRSAFHRAQSIAPAASAHSGARRRHPATRDRLITSTPTLRIAVAGHVENSVTHGKSDQYRRVVIEKQRGDEA